MHGPGSTTVDVASETAAANAILRASMRFVPYATAVRSEIGINADLIAEDFIAGETPYRPTMVRYMILKQIQSRIIAAIHQKYNVR
jgi:hypothetical protein